MNKRRKIAILGILMLLFIGTMIMLFIQMDEREKKFQEMKSKINLIDSTIESATTAKEELQLINKEVWERINRPIKTISSVKHSKLIIFISNDFGEGSALVSIMDLNDVEAGMDLSEFHPQFKEYNFNKIKDVETFKINRKSINALQKFLKKKAVLIYKADILGEYTYIINIVE